MNAADRLAEIQARANFATEGPWAAWLDQDGAEHMHGLLMVGNAAAVIPDGQSWVEGVDVNPIAHTYCEEDRAFIAHARADVPALVSALLCVLDLHRPNQLGSLATCERCRDLRGSQIEYPCPTVRAVEAALGEVAS